MNHTKYDTLHHTMKDTKNRSHIIAIQTDQILLVQFLKLAAIAASGGEAKQRIARGDVQVNGEICYQKKRALKTQDKVTVDGREYLIRVEP